MNRTTFYQQGIIANGSSYKWFMLVLMMLGTFMAVVDTTIVNVALPTIVAHYHSSISAGQWIVSGYLLSMSVMLLVSDWFGNRFGYKTVYLVGLLIFTLGSWLCSVALSLEFLVVSRFIEGVGSGIVQPLALAMVLREFSQQQRALALGFWAMASGAAVSLGPFLGGYLITEFHWSSIFIINVPIGLLSMVGVLVVLKDFLGQTRSRFDVVGFGLLVLSIPVIVYSLVRFGDATTGLLSDLVWFGLGVILVAVFLIYQSKAKNPLLDLNLLKDQRFKLTLIVTFFYGIALMGGNYILPEYLQHSLGYTVLKSGLMFLPVGIIQVIMSPVSGVLIRKLGDLRLIYCGILILVAYFGMSIFFDQQTPFWVIMLSLYLRGLGIGLSFTALNHLSFSTLNKDQMGAASAMSNTVRQFSSSVSVALLTMILTINVHANSDLTKAGNFLKGVNYDFVFMTGIIIAAIIPLLLLEKQKKMIEKQKKCSKNKKNRKFA